MSKIKLISEGMAQCIYEPRGDCGLEGFDLDNHYKFENVKHETKGGEYYRLYHKDVDYYETCGPLEFKRYFLPITKKIII
jgi:hypothetical protein